MCDSNNYLDYRQSNYLESEMSGFSQMLTENSDRQNDRSGD